MGRGSGWTAAAVLGAALVATPAVAGPVSLGAEASFASDLPDAVSDGHTRLPIGLSLAIPLRWRIIEHVGLRFALRADYGSGNGQLTWNTPIDGAPVRFGDDGARLWAVSGVAVVGPEVWIPVPGIVKPSFGAAAGGGIAGTWTEPSETATALQPGVYGTAQAVWTAEVFGGVSIAVSERLDLRIETGYSATHLPARAPNGLSADLEARREGYVWNTVRAGLGFAASL